MSVSVSECVPAWARQVNGTCPVGRVAVAAALAVVAARAVHVHYMYAIKNSPEALPPALNDIIEVGESAMPFMRGRRRAAA